MQHLRQHLPPTQPQQYVCCYNPSTPGPLIMLANHQQILTRILKDAVEPYYFWLYSDPLFANSTIQLLSLQIKNRSIVFTTVDQIQEFLTPANKMSFKKIIVISSNQFKDNIYKFVRAQQFLGAVLFDVKQKCDENKQKQKKESEGESLKVEETDKDMMRRKMKVCKDFQQLNRFLNANQWNMTEIKQFSNFVSLKQEVQKSTVLYRTMIAMIKSQIKGQTKLQILSHLECLVKKVAKHHPKLNPSIDSILQAISAIKKSKPDNKRIIIYYTAQRYRFNILLSIILKAADCPTQFFCVQPLVKELFDAVQFINDHYAPPQLTCYRGYSVNSEQVLKFLKNMGEVIQNLGFMSTSLKNTLAFNFRKNIFYQIHVPTYKGKGRAKRGFANISSCSEYQYESQILFNPLCSFLLMQLKQSSLIQEIGQQPQIEYQICLRYIYINEDANKQQQQDQNDKITKILISLLDQMHSEINSQSDVILKPSNKAQVEKSWMYCKFLIDRDEKLVRILNSIEIYKQWNLSMEMGTKNDSGLKILEDQMEISKDEISHYLKLIKNIGSILDFTGHFKQALDFYYKCLDMQKSMPNDTESNYLSILNKIALAKIEVGMAKEVLQIYRTVEQAGRKIQGQKKEKAKYLKYCNNIMLALSMLGRYSQAFEYYKKWENQAKQVFSQYHPIYIKNLINKAHVLLKLCRYEQAYEISKKCEYLMRNVLREDNLSYINILHQMMNCLTNLSRLSEAETIYKKNEKIMRQVVGENNPRYYLNMTSFGNILLEQGKYQEALNILQSCLEIVKSNFGENTRYYTFILSKIGDCLLSQGKLIEALDFYRKCQSIQRGIYDNNSPIYLLNYIKIGTVFIRRGYYKQGLAIFKQKQSQLKTALGQKHPHYLLSLKSICQAYIRLRRNDQALEYCRKIEELENQMGSDKDTINYLLGMNMTGDALVQNQKVDEGLKYFLEFQSKFKSIYGDKHPYYFNGIARIANALIIKCKFNDAFQLFTQKLNQGLFHSNNQSHVLILKVIMNLFICLGDYVALLSLFVKFKSQFMIRYICSLSKILQVTKMYKQLKLLLRFAVKQMKSKGNKTRSRESDILFKKYKQTSEEVTMKEGALRRKINNNKCFLNF